MIRTAAIALANILLVFMIANGAILLGIIEWSTGIPVATGTVIAAAIGLVALLTHRVRQNRQEVTA